MILNRQRRVRVPVRALNEFVQETCRALRLPIQAFTVCLVPDDEMARWNLAYRGKTGPTDVLSFPSDGSQAKSRNRKKASVTRTGASSAKRGASAALSARSAAAAFTSAPSSSAGLPDYLGDIAIAPAVARRNARQFERTFVDEMRILILHGILHLMGYDHETDTGQMNRREQRLRRILGLA